MPQKTVIYSVPVEVKFDAKLGVASGTFVEIGVMSKNRSGFFNTEANNQKAIDLKGRVLNLNHDMAQKIGYVDLSEIKPGSEENSSAVFGSVVIWKEFIPTVAKESVVGFSVEVRYYDEEAEYQWRGEKLTYADLEERGMLQSYKDKKSFQGDPIYTWIHADDFTALALVTYPYKPAFPNATIDEIQMTKDLMSGGDTDEQELVSEEIDLEQNNEEEIMTKEEMMEIVSAFATQFAAAMNESFAKMLEASDKKAEEKSHEAEMAAKVKELEEKLTEAELKLTEELAKVKAAKPVSEGKMIQSFDAPAPAVEEEGKKNTYLI